MAVPDDTALKALITSNIPDANPGLPRRATAAFVRAALFSLIDWVKTAINGNLSTWYKLGTTSAPLTNADDIYRAGRVFVGRTNDDGTGAALQANTFSLYGVSFLGGTGMMPTETTDFDTLSQVGTYCIGGSVWGTGMHAPGNAFTGVFTFGTLIVSRSSAGNCTQMYLDNSQNYIYLRHKWATNAWGAWICVNRPVDMIINNSLSFDASLNNKKIALYPGPNDHQFFGLGISSATLRYQAADVNSSHVFYAGLTPATSQELMRIQGNGLIGVNTNAPTSTLHVKGATGHQQLRLETSYTPTSSSDANGATGQVCWDATYVYVKTAAGWRRAAFGAAW